jgi:adenylosuccinate lyase
MSDLSPLTAISPLDGRYWQKVQSLSPFFSEEALIRYRIRFEAQYLLFLSKKRVIKPIPVSASLKLLKRIDSLNQTDIAKVKEHEKRTSHDVKAVEYFLRDVLKELKIESSQYIHIGLTSDDVNEAAYALMMRDARDAVVLPQLLQLIKVLANMAEKYKATPMLARTHGQPAVPTTVGKELIVFAVRLHRQYQSLKHFVFESKVSGAVGNFQAQVAGFPAANWLSLSHQFLAELKLEANDFCTQILPAESYLEFFHHLELVNAILIDLDQDIWRYISDEYFLQHAVQDEVGSSTMPQKVNPIDFENSEGNLGLANAMFAHFCEKFPISRLQRDLSDSTVKRNIGVAFAHSVLGYSSCIRGLGKIEPNIPLLARELNAHWEIVTEGLQTILRSAGDSAAYEKVKSLSRGKKITHEIVAEFIASLTVSASVKNRLRSLSPITYLGLAETLVKNGIAEINKGGV